jgi:hypothetical protein
MTFILLAYFINQANLSMLELFRLGIEPSLPGELLGETISQPDINVDDMIPI